jgi:hypothetical protein
MFFEFMGVPQKVSETIYYENITTQASLVVLADQIF